MLCKKSPPIQIPPSEYVLCVQEEEPNLTDPTRQTLFGYRANQQIMHIRDLSAVKDLDHVK